MEKNKLTELEKTVVINCVNDYYENMHKKYIESKKLGIVHAISLESLMINKTNIINKLYEM